MSIHPRSSRPAGCLAMALLAAPALGDGKFFAPPGYPSPGVPGQRAAIVLQGDVETMIVDTELVGASADLAWLIPTPSPPEVLAAPRGVIETLELATGTAFVAQPIDRLRLALVLGLVLLAACGLLVPGRAGGVCFGLVAIVSAGALLLLPAIGKARGGSTFDAASKSAASADVEILSEGVAGEFEFTVLRGKGAEPVVQWLRDGGFAIPDAALPIIEAHVDEGWVFVAGRLSEAAQAERRATTQTLPDFGATRQAATIWRPHPVALRFQSATPVYPMRLTGVGEHSVVLRLMVLASTPMQCDVLTRTAVLPIERRETGAPPMVDLPAARCALGSPALLELAPAATVISRFEGTLLPAHLAADVTMRPDVAAAPFRDLRWRRLDGRDQAVTIAAGAVTLILLAMAAVAGARGRRGPSRWPWLAVALVLGTGVGVVSHLRDAAAFRDRRLARVQAFHLRLAEELASMARGSIPSPELAATLRREGERSSGTNQLTGEPIREEASPGNWTLAFVDGRVDYHWYDAAGSAQRIPITGEGAAPAATAGQ